MCETWYETREEEESEWVSERKQGGGERVVKAAGRDIFVLEYVIFFLMDRYYFYYTWNLLIYVRTLLHYNCRHLGAVRAWWNWMCRCQLNPCRLEDLIIHGNHVLSPQWTHSAQPWWMFCLLSLHLCSSHCLVEDQDLQIFLFIRNSICCYSWIGKPTRLVASLRLTHWGDVCSWVGIISINSWYVRLQVKWTKKY